MKKNALLFIVIILNINFMLAQPLLQWQKSYGSPGCDEANSIQQTSDGGYIIAGGSSYNGGNVTGNHGDWDLFFLGLNSSGNKTDRKSTRLNSSHGGISRMPSSA